MHKRILPIAFTAIILLAFFSWNCTKLDVTDIGSDLLPAVDNVNTFDTSLIVNSTQGLFNDTVYINALDDFGLGAVNNDPLFGTTRANIFMQLKPPFYPYYFGNTNDTLNGFGAGIDSVVLCLNYKGFWGDSTLPIHLEVREINDANFRDSVYKENPSTYQPFYSGAILGAKDVDVRNLGDYVKFTNGRDSVRNQIRIKLSNSFAMQLFNRDSIQGNSSNNAFFNDSIYRRFYNGIAVLASGGGNGLMYVNISDTASKLEVHYRRRNNGVVDSVYSSFRLNTSASAANAPESNTVNNVIRNRAGFPVLSPTSGEHYLQAAPGSYVNVDIPGLTTFGNKIIHRAELIIEQIPTDPVLDDKLSAPNFLYLDLKDTGTTKWKPIYLDLNTNQFYDPDQKLTIQYIANPIDYAYFGGFRRNKYDAFGNAIKHYNFNVSRYVQQIVTRNINNYQMRVYAPFNINYPQYSPTLIPYGNNIAFGRVRIGSGSNPNYRLRLRIIYSNL